MAGQFIFHKDDPSNDKLYVVLDGKVGVVLPAEKTVFEDQIANELKEKFNYANEAKQRFSVLYANRKKTSGRLQSISGGSTNNMFTLIQQNQNLLQQHSTSSNNLQARMSRIGLNLVKSVPVIEETVEQKIARYGELKKELTVGEMFGERALIDSTQKRSASIIALEETDLIILLKKDFETVKKIYNRDNIEKKEFLLQQLPHLDDIIGEKTLLESLTHFAPRKFHKNHKIYIEGQPVDFICLIKEGTVTLEKEITHEILNENKPVFLPDYTVPSQKHVKISDVGSNSMIGEEGLFGELSEYTIFVNSMACSVYYLPKHLIKHYPPLMIDAIKNNFLIKNDNRKLYFESVLDRIRGSSENEGLGFQIPSDVMNLKDAITNGTKEKLLTKENFGFPTKMAQNYDYLLQKEGPHKEKIKTFYGKYTRKANYQTLTHFDVEHAENFYFSVKNLQRKEQLPHIVAAPQIIKLNSIDILNIKNELHLQGDGEILTTQKKHVGWHLPHKKEVLDLNNKIGVRYLRSRVCQKKMNKLKPAPIEHPDSLSFVIKKVKKIRERSLKNSLFNSFSQASASFTTVS